jgi:signal transduction histidine kinase
MIFLKHIFLCAMLCIGFSNLSSAQRNPNHYSTEQGLSNNFVYCVFKDSRGILWAATESGLNCFNGNKWEYFDAETGQVGEKYNDYLFMGITEDEDKNLYFCTYGQGIYVYNLQNKNVSKICKENNSQINSNQFLNIGYYQNKIYALSNSSVEIIDAKSRKWYKTLLTPSENNYSYLDLLIKSDTINIVNSGIGVQQFVKNQLINTISIHDKSALLQEIENWDNQYITASSNGIFVSEKNKLVKQQIVFDHKNISNTNFLGLGKLHHQKYFISTTFGKLKLDSCVQNTLYLSSDKHNQSFIKEGSFICNYADNENNAVLIGMQSGIVFSNNTQKRFTHFDISGDLKSAVLCAYQIDDSIVLLGTQKGLLYYNRNNFSSKLIHNASGDNFVYDIKKVKGQIFCFCTNGIFCYEHKYLTNNLPIELKKIAHFSIRQVKRISLNTFVAIDIAENKLHLWHIDKNEIKSIEILGSNVNNVVMLDSVLYYSANDGLFFYDLVSKVNKEIICNQQLKECRNIYVLNNKLYAVFSKLGIIEIVPNAKPKLILAVTNKIISSILFKDKVYLATTENILEYANNKITYYTPSSGYQNNGFSNLDISDFGNQICIGQENGFTLLGDKVIDNGKFNNQILLNGLVYFKNGTYHLNKNTNFTFNQNTLLLHLACTNYLQPDRNKIWYRINAQEWISLGLEKQLLLNQLSPGEYSIELMLDTCLNPKTPPTIYAFTILPPWYKTWWFKLLLILGSGSILFFGTRYYFSSELKKKQLQIEKLEAVHTERERMSADLHDDIGSHISTVQLLANKVSENTSSEYAAEFKTTIKELGQKIREIIWVTKSENDTLENFILYVRQYITKQMDLADIALVTNLPKEIPEHTMPSAMRRDVYLCIKECINNIVKHANAGKVIMEITIFDNKVEINIQDDGIGLKDGNAFGNGLKTMHARLKKYNGSYELKGGKGCRSVLRFEV